MDTIDTLSRFLSLAGLAAVLLGGVGVASGISAYVARKLDTAAVLRCLGATAQQVLVSAALSKDEILASWRQATLVQGLVIAFNVIVLGFLGFRLVDQINLRIKAEEEARRTGEALLNLNRTLEKLAMQDGLTGLANRRQFDTVLQNELSRAVRSASSLALIMIDVDYFKKYNDIYGHLAGDECLRQIGKITGAVAGVREQDDRIARPVRGAFQCRATDINAPTLPQSHLRVVGAVG